MLRYFFGVIPGFLYIIGAGSVSNMVSFTGDISSILFSIELYKRKFGIVLFALE